MNKILLILGLSCLSGILGRWGGSDKGNTKIRDIGIPLIFTGLMVWLTLKSFNLWLLGAYLVGFLALMGSLTTYWDWLFGFDNLWFSGFVVGLSTFPYAIIDKHWVMLAIHSLALAIIWGSLNRIKYDRILFWRRDVAEEFLRYASVIPFLLI